MAGRVPRRRNQSPVAERPREESVKQRAQRSSGAAEQRSLASMNRVARIADDREGPFEHIRVAACRPPNPVVGVSRVQGREREQRAEVFISGGGCISGASLPRLVQPVPPATTDEAARSSCSKGGDAQARSEGGRAETRREHGEYGSGSGGTSRRQSREARRVCGDRSDERSTGRG